MESDSKVQISPGSLKLTQTSLSVEESVTWKPYGYPKTLTPWYSCIWTGGYACTRPFPNLPIFINTQKLVMFFCCMALVIIAVVSVDCHTSGKLSTASALLSFLFVPHCSVLHFILGIPFERALDYHKMFAYTTVYTGFIHWGSCPSSGTGYLLLAPIVLLLILSLPYFRISVFETFYKSHWILVFATLWLSLTHYSARKIFLGASFWLLDVFYRYFFLAWSKYPREAKVYAMQANVIKIILPKGQFKYRAGQYIFLCIPKLTSFQWHPFSISSSPHQDTVSIHIRVLGDWTNELYTLCKPMGVDGISLRVLMEGPYGEPAIDIDGPKYKSFLLISGGIGITPMQSICNDLLHQLDKGRPVNKIWFVWACADKDMVEVMFNETEIRSSCENDMRRVAWENRLPTAFTPDVLTRINSFNETREPKDMEDSSSVFDPLYSEYYLTRVRRRTNVAVANIDPKVQQCLRFGRPKLDEIFAKMKDMCQSHKDDRCAVMVCGPPSLTSDVRSRCSKLSGGGVAFDFHHEKFNF